MNNQLGESTKQMNRFWESKKLNEFTQEEWELLCDGCAKCCLHKLEDEETGELYFTSVACSKLNLETCRCGHYQHRFDDVPNCLKVKSNDPALFSMLPNTCAYRKVFENKPLESWHPLISGKTETVHLAGISVLGKAFAEEDVSLSELEDYIIEFKEESL